MAEQPEQISGTSLDIAAEKRAQLKQLFPTVFSESVDANGNLVESVDFEKLKAELGTFTELYENRRERYGMDWPGKKEALKLIQTVSTATLKPCREESVNFDTTENLFIEGENLEVLKLLQKSYYGKVKMIYIDPPYNTGNEFIYPDNYSESLATYLQYAGLADAEGKKFSTNTANEGRFHTKWLNMMYPRLYLARNLLRDDGVIFISIDDNEVSNLRKLCDEIFGEENFIATVIWQKVYSPKNSARHFSVDHDFILIYAKHAEIWMPYLLPRTEDMEARYTNPDDDPRGPWKPGDLSARNYYGAGTYPVVCPSGRVIDGPPPGTYWRVSKIRLEELNSDGRIWWGSDGNNVPAIKRFLTEVKAGRVPQTLWTYDEVGHTQEAKKELISLVDFPNSDMVFDTPKPTRLIQRILQIATSAGSAKQGDLGIGAATLCEREADYGNGISTTGTDIPQKRGEPEIVLDFFAGSGSTMDAVFRQNAEDGGNRSCIIVQLPEPIPGANTGPLRTIADIGKERIRRVIKKLDAEDSGKLPFGNASPQDRGFKVLKLDKSNFKQWQALPPDTSPETLVKQLKLFIDHIDAKAGLEDLLYEILIKEGFQPSEHIETLTMAGKTVYAVAQDGLLLCLENEVNAELIHAVAEYGPKRFICLDAAFGGNDQLKANAVQTFAALNMSKEKANPILFKTV